MKEMEGDSEANITMLDDKKRQHIENIDSEKHHDMEMDLFFGDCGRDAFFQRKGLVNLLCRN